MGRKVRVERMWINQPSTLQPFHKWHGQNVLAVEIPGEPDRMDVYFLSGDYVNMEMPRLSLSQHWR